MQTKSIILTKWKRGGMEEDRMIEEATKMAMKIYLTSG